MHVGAGQRSGSWGPQLLGAAGAVLAFAAMPAWRTRDQVMCKPGVACPPYIEQDHSLLALLLQPGAEAVPTALPALALVLSLLLGLAVLLLARRVLPRVSRWLGPRLRPDRAKVLVAALGLLGLVGAMRNWMVIHRLGLPDAAMTAVDALHVAVLPFTLAALLLLHLATALLQGYAHLAGLGLGGLGPVWYVPPAVLPLVLALWAALWWLLACLAVEGLRRLRARPAAAVPA